MDATESIPKRTEVLLMPWDESHPKRYRRRTTTRVDGDVEDALSLWLLMPVAITIGLIVIVGKAVL